MTTQPGLITLFGAGETAPAAQKIYHALFSQMRAAPRVAVLETPAGFEPNSAYVAGQVAAYLQKRLQNFHPETTVVPARKRGTAFSPDAPAIVEPLYDANVIFMGPGSPTYAVRQLRAALAWDVLRARHRLGASLIFSSAMVLAASRHTLPIYEIYKAGEELHWKAGLDLFGDFGFSLVFVSHWNNGDGGETLDTSRCYLGRARFEQLLAMLPADPARRVVGIDENTALTIDLAGGQCTVRGAGDVTIMHGGEMQRFAAGAHFDLAILGSYRLLDAQAGIPDTIWRSVIEKTASAYRAASTPDGQVLALLAKRTEARTHKAWVEADQLRTEIEVLGWRVLDTPDGPQLEAMETKVVEYLVW
jgi:cyanophycinase-like exopeptidase